MRSIGVVGGGVVGLAVARESSSPAATSSLAIAEYVVDRVLGAAQL